MFKGNENIYVLGEGEHFIVYCMAAMMTVEPDSKSFKTNAGLLFANYLLARDGTQKIFESAGGLTAAFKEFNGQNLFMIGK
jgi:hypothetical protein